MNDLIVPPSKCFDQSLASLAPSFSSGSFSSCWKSEHPSQCQVTFTSMNALLWIGEDLERAIKRIKEHLIVRQSARFCNLEELLAAKDRKMGV